MTARMRWLVILLLFAGAAEPGYAQQPPLAPPPARPLPAPSGPLPPPPPPPPDLSAPLPSAPGALTLDAAITQALTNQPEIQARLKDYDAARFRVDEALSVLLPQLTGVAAATKSQAVIVQTTPSTSVTSVFTSNREFQQTFNAQLQFSQILFDFGQNGAAVQAARKTADYRLAQGRFDVRVGTIIELVDAQLALTQAQQTQAQALADYRIGLARLDLAVGRE